MFIFIVIFLWVFTCIFLCTFVCLFIMLAAGLAIGIGALSASEFRKEALPQPLDTVPTVARSSRDLAGLLFKGALNGLGFRGLGFRV